MSHCTSCLGDHPLSHKPGCAYAREPVHPKPDLDVKADEFVKIMQGILDSLEANELDKNDANIKEAADRCRELIDAHTPRITVYKVQLVGFNGPCVHETIDAALEEVGELLAEDDETEVTISREKMTRQEIEDMGEFEGY